jgi:hypothetical protein
MSGRLRLALLAATVAVAAVPAGAAAAAPPSVTSVVLTSRTAISWTGAKGLRLVVPDDVDLPPYGARLTLRGGSYAFVRIVIGLCDTGERCMKGGIEYTRAMAPYSPSVYGPGGDHFAHIAGDNLRPSGYELYLFTDGAATLTFDRTGLPARPNAVTAGGRVRGTVHELPVQCAAPACTRTDGHANRLVYGGEAGDVGASGNAGLVLGAYDHPTAAGWVSNERHDRVCTYPRHSKDPTPPHSDTGCEMTDPYVMVGGGGGNARQTAYENPAARGTVWVGYQLTQAHDLGDPVTFAYGVWFTYGFR